MSKQIEVDIIAMAKAQAATRLRQLPNGRKVHNTSSQLQEATRRAMKSPSVPVKNPPAPVKRQQVINPRSRAQVQEPEPEEARSVAELEEAIELGDDEDVRLNAHMAKARQAQQGHKLSDKRIPGAFAELMNQKKKPVENVVTPKSTSPKSTSKTTPKMNQSKLTTKAKIDDDIDINDLDDLQIDDEAPKKSKKEKTKEPKEQKKASKKKVEEEEEDDNVEVEEDDDDEFEISDVDDELEEDTPKKPEKAKKVKAK